MANTFIIRPAYGATSTFTVVGTPNLFLIGPPCRSGQGRGLYICEARTGVSGSQTVTYRWVNDQQIGIASTPPTTYSAHGL